MLLTVIKTFVWPSKYLNHLTYFQVKSDYAKAVDPFWKSFPGNGGDTVIQAGVGIDRRIGEEGRVLPKVGIHKLKLVPIAVATDFHVVHFVKVGEERGIRVAALAAYWQRRYRQAGHSLSLAKHQQQVPRDSAGRKKTH